jgi:hypothetical protein
MQNVADAHDTDARDETVVFGGTGYDDVVQLEPSQRSITAFFRSAV